MPIRRLCRRAAMRLALALSLAAPTLATAQPRVWMFPTPYMKGQEFREMFQNPAGWQRTRQSIEGIAYADHWLNSQFNDAQLRAWLPQISRWGLKLALEVGAVKPGSPTGQHAFDVSHPRWDRFIADGGRIDAIAMDEPLAATVRDLHLPMQYGVEQTAIFIQMVRHAYPNMAIGDIESYPYFQPGEIMQFIDALQGRLRQMGVRGLDFVRLDVDWMHFHPGDAKGRLGWRGAKMIEDQCHRRHIPFSLIYWAANYPSLSKQGEATPGTWTSAILDEAAQYAAVGGVPDEFFVESWILSDNDPVPPHVTPDSSPDTMAGSVLALASRFASQRYR